MTTEPTVAHDYRIGADGLLAVRLFSGSARLRGVPGDRVRIHTTDGAPIDGLKLEPGDGSLSIMAQAGFSLSLGRNRQHRSGPLTIDVPAAATVVVETASGDLEAHGLRGDQRYRTLSGQVHLGDAAGTITIDSVSGDVRIDGQRDLGLTVRTVSGDCTLVAATISALQVTTTSGDTRISGRLIGAERYGVQSVSGDTLVATDSGLRVEARTVAGHVRSDVPSTIDELDSGGAMIIGGGGPILAFRSMSGDLRIVHAEAATPGINATPPAPYRPSGHAAVVQAPAATIDSGQLEILHDLERGTIDVEEADRRLAAFDPDDEPRNGPGDEGAR